MVAARLETLKHGQKKGDTPNGVSRPEAAAKCAVSERSACRAGVVLAEGTPELVAAVDAGLIPVSRAVKVAKEKPKVQKAASPETRANPGFQGVQILTDPTIRLREAGSPRQS